MELCNLENKITKLFPDVINAISFLLSPVKEERISQKISF